jgi:hypothetical protein
MRKQVKALAISSASRILPGHRHGSSGRSASERKIRTWFPRRQPRSMRLAVGVRSADPVFVTVIGRNGALSFVSATRALGDPVVRDFHAEAIIQP